MRIRTRTAVAALSLALATVASPTEAQPGAGRVIAVGAKRFEFTPAEIHVKAGEPVTLRVTSADVTHGFFSRELGIDADLAPGKTVEVTFTARAAGRYAVICDHFCGPGHGGMRMVIVAE